MLFFLDIFSNFIEKAEKLLTWQDKPTTKTFFIFLICAFFVVTFLPIRYFVIIGLITKFSRGQSYYQRRYTGNKEACKIEIYNLMTDNNYLKQ